MTNKHYMLFPVPIKSDLPASKSSMLSAHLHNLIIAATYCAAAQCCMHMVAPDECSEQLQGWLHPCLCGRKTAAACWRAHMLPSHFPSCSWLQGPRRLPSRVASRLQPILLEVEVDEAAGRLRCTLPPTSPRFRALQALGSAIPQLAQQVCPAARLQQAALSRAALQQLKANKRGAVAARQASNACMLNLPYNRQVRAGCCDSWGSVSDTHHVCSAWCTGQRWRCCSVS